MTTKYDLGGLSLLSTEQYNKCCEAALMRFQRRISTRPGRKDFE